MKVIHVLRKPLSEGTVASNTLKHGVGGLNIDASRVHGGVSTGGVSSGGSAFGQDAGWNKTNVYRQEIDRSMPQGRWPANLILQHLDGCRCEGTKRVKGSELNHRCSSESVGGIYSPMGTVHKRGHTDSDGKETVANWICVEGCPVKTLDEQSGVLTSGTILPHHRRTVPRMGHGGVYGDETPRETAEVYFAGDTGGASRFFKQVGGSKE